MSASSRSALMAASLCLSITAAHAQTRGPAAQYWVDLATSNTSIPGMPQGGGLMGGLMGGAAGGFGGAGKTLDAELYVRAHPSGAEGSHAIPGGMSMGPSLPLVPLRAQPASRGQAGDERADTAEKPKGRILLYWGCGDSIRAGQPRVLDFAKQDYREYAQFFASHGGVSKGVQRRPGHALWPNERDHRRVPDNASLQGEHAVSGDGVPASLKFGVDAAHDFLPALRISTKGRPADGVQVAWNGLEHAKAYFLTAQGMVEAKGAQDMILWSSSERPENGWALMTYQSPAQIAKLLQQKVVLSPSTTNCTVPKGIFDKAEGAMLNMIAYGPELNLAHPPRPAKAPADWQPEWTARVRIKSTGMSMLGLEDEGGGGRAERADSQPSGSGETRNTAQDVVNEVVNPVNVIRGLFGR